jgi:hypothetical protein
MPDAYFLHFILVSSISQTFRNHYHHHKVHHNCKRLPLLYFLGFSDSNPSSSPLQQQALFPNPSSKPTHSCVLGVSGSSSSSLPTIMSKCEGEGAAIIHTQLREESIILFYLIKKNNNK